MPISVTCGNCGQKLAAKDEHAGKKVKCPKCGQAISIPAMNSGPAPPAAAAKTPRSVASAAHELLDEIGLSHHVEGQQCPECGESIPNDAVLCVHCGYHLKLKRQIKGMAGAEGGAVKKKAPSKPLTETDKTLVRAAVELEKEPVQQEQGYGSKWGAWLLMLLMVGIAAGVIAGGIAYFTYMEGQYQRAEKDDE